MPRGAAPPRHGTIRHRNCTGESRSIDIPFAVEALRIASAAVARCAEMTLAVPGFAPVRLAPPELGVGEVRDLGSIALTEAGAVALRVRAAPSMDVQPGVRIFAVRAHELAAQRHDFDAEKLALATAVTDREGWARLSGIPEEEVVLVVQHPGRRHPVITEPYTFSAGDETVLDDLLLEPPAAIRVTVAMPDALASTVELHDVELAPEGHNHWPKHAPIRARLNEERIADLVDVPPG
ncbi:MAG TPA: hypothetical protein VE010_16945, partial [Thermoanaerobaculia bacterium]|nr:hypothetical protein [Thermoanaerobaculia bacterium]